MTPAERATGDAPAGARRPRTFKPRRRGLSAQRAEWYASALSRWGVATAGPPIRLDALFGGPGPYVLDVGFGAGEALLELARARPAERVLGVEVHTTGLAAVLEAVERDGLGNVRVCDGDVLDLLPRLPDGELAEIRVLFPDPWPKRRQRPRRLVRPDVVERLARLLAPGGTLHLATDDADYATWIEAVCAARPELSGGRVPRPHWRPVTRFEHRGRMAGRQAVDLAYCKVGGPAGDSGPPA